MGSKYWKGPRRNLDIIVILLDLIHNIGDKGKTDTDFFFNFMVHDTRPHIIIHNFSRLSKLYNYIYIYTESALTRNTCTVILEVIRNLCVLS